eukprot:7885657-Pyramimonas_sp.AAC.1
MQGISLWVYIHTNQPSSLHYLLDARHGTRDGYISNTATGTLWSRMYLNSKETPILWAMLPKEQWAHVHLESSLKFSDDINFMSRTTLDAATSYPYEMGCLHGRLAEVYFWNRLLTLYEVHQVSGLRPNPSILYYVATHAGW